MTSKTAYGSKMLLGLLCLLIAGCKPAGPVVPAPGPEVQESFKEFANAATQRLGVGFSHVGYHAGWKHTSGEDALYVPEIDGAHYLWGGMEASFSLQIHSHPAKMPETPDFIRLDFVTRDKDKGPWLLVLDDGFLHSMEDESNRSSLPFGVQAGIKQAFGPDSIEYRDWLVEQVQNTPQSAQQPTAEK